MAGGLEVAVDYLIAWYARKAGVDPTLHTLIATKLSDDPAIAKLKSEIAETGHPTTRTQARVRLALEEAADSDPTFAAALRHTITVSGGVTADRGGIALGAVTGGHVTINQFQTRELATHVIHSQITALNAVVGREAELRQLRESFRSNTSPVVLTGMGGVGKTSLARAYAHRHRDDYGLIWWVRAEDPAAIDAEFRSLLEILLPPGRATAITDAREAAFAVLAQRTDPLLLVLDNVPNPEAAQNLIPPAGHILITSRATAWPNPTTITPLDTDTAVTLLTERSLDRDPIAAEALATELGGLPLALTQAAGFVRANASSLATYLRLYRSADLHDDGRPPDYPHTVATTWQVAMDRLSEDARILLNLMAFCAPDAIPVDLLFSSMDELARHRAIGELGAYSLVTSTGSNVVNVHRLVQAVTRKQLGAYQAIVANMALKLIKALLPADRHTALGPAWNALRTHLQAALDHLPPDDPETLTMRQAVAVWTGEAGNPALARDLFAELLPARERVSGAEHLQSLGARYHLAVWTGKAGDAVRARNLLADLLPRYESVYGAEHPQTLTALHGLAYWVGEAGDAVRARTLFTELLPKVERVCGAEHADTLHARHELARWTAKTGDAVRARELFAEVLTIEERVMGAEHPETLITRHELAYSVGAAGDPVQARDQLIELLSIEECVMGAEHPSTLTTRGSVAYWSMRAGDIARARELYTELLPICERVLGAEHPSTLETRNNLRVLDGWC